MTNHAAAPVALTCSECGIGHYHRAPLTTGWDCDECGHNIATCDVDLESGEVLTTDTNGALAYLPAAY